MRNTLLPACLLSLACGAAFASPSADRATAGPARGAEMRLAVNPQPLPPIHGDDAPLQLAINPQPLPPHDPRPGEELMAVAGGPPTVVDIVIGRRG